MGFTALKKFLATSLQQLVLISILLLVSCFLLLASFNPVNAQTPTDEPAENTSQTQYLTPNTNPDVPKNLGTWTQSVMIEVMQSMVCQLAGTLASNNSSMQCLGVDPQTGKIGFVKNGNGAIGIMTHFIAVLYTPPAHFSDYTRYLAQNFGIAKPAFAQNPGLESIGTLGDAWTVFRNFVYVFFVIIFIVIGVAIMLRVRIDPRTVMSIQNQIPRLIVGLILVTFSFAIAGLLIDLMWLTIYLVINVFNIADPRIRAGQVTEALNYNPLDFANNDSVLKDLGGIITDVAGLIHSIVYNMFTNSGVQIQSSGNFIDWVLGAVGGLVNTIIGALFGFVAGALAFLIILIAVLWALLRLWFVLLLAFINILIDIIFAPFWIVAGLLPGAGPRVGFGAWLRDILANLSAFPAVIAMFLLGRLFMDTFKGGSVEDESMNSFLPPLIANPTVGNEDAIGSLIALGIILSTPAVVKMTKEAFKAAGINYGPIGQSLGAGQAFVGGVGGTMWRRMYWRDPRTGQTHGVAAEIGRGAGRRLNDTRPIQAVRSSRLFNNPVGRAIGGLRAGGRGEAPPEPPYQGPVPPGDDEERFRRTGRTG